MNRTAPISRPRPPKQTAEKASTVPQNTRTLILKPDAPTPLMQREVTIQGIKMSLGQAMEHLKRTHNTYFILPTSIKSIINRNLEQYAAHTPQLTFANIQELGQFIEHLTNHALQMSTLSPNQKKLQKTCKRYWATNTMQITLLTLLVPEDLQQKLAID